MTTEWIGYLNVTTTDKIKGNELASLIDPDVGGIETFDKGLELRVIGAGGVATAWAAQSPLKPIGLDYCVEFTSNGPYPMLTALGLTQAQIEEYQACITLEFGAREVYEGRLLTFITEQGYEIIPQ